MEESRYEFKGYLPVIIRFTALDDAVDGGDEAEEILYLISEGLDVTIDTRWADGKLDGREIQVYKDSMDTDWNSSLKTL